VAGQQLKSLSPNSPSSTFYSFDATANNWHNEPTSSTMTLGKGYIFQAPATFSEMTPSIFEATFAGIPNNGLITLPITNSKSPNLIGNPYPSAIDADAFILENQNVLQGSLYFWTHNTPIANGQYTSDDYAVYTIIGGVGTAAKNVGINNTIPNGNIASGQAFFVLGNNQQGNVVFKNAMRLKGENNLFFKSSNSQKSSVISNFEKHRFWLNLSNKEGAFKQILLGYATGATNKKDALFDGLSLDSNQWLDFYTLNDGDKNSIQARALPFITSDLVPIGYRAKEEGDFTISLDYFDGLFANQNIYLEDKELAEIFDLKKGEYSFTTAKGTFDNRFVLRYENKNTIPVEITSEVQVGYRNNQIQISSSKELVRKVLLYTIEGRLLYQADQLETKIQTIDATLWESKVLIVQITLATGEIVSRKVVL
jgi:hypothetical protein